MQNDCSKSTVDNELILFLWEKNGPYNDVTRFGQTVTYIELMKMPPWFAQSG